MTKAKTPIPPTSREVWTISGGRAELFHTDPLPLERAPQIGTRLPIDEVPFKQFLSDNLDVFPWAPTNMPGIDLAIFCR